MFGGRRGKCTADGLFGEHRCNLQKGGLAIVGLSSAPILTGSSG